MNTFRNFTFLPIGLCKTSFLTGCAFPASSIVSVAIGGRNQNKIFAFFCRQQPYLPAPTVISSSFVKQQILEQMVIG
jgi:hypothetical protein